MEEKENLESIKEQKTEETKQVSVVSRLADKTGIKKSEKNKLLKLDALLNTAFDLFTTQGIGKTSISDITSRSGVAKGTFYLYFKDKNDIRSRLIAHTTSQLFGRAYERLQEHPEINQLNDKILFIMDTILDELNENHALLNFIAKDLSWGVFKKALYSAPLDDDIDFREIYNTMLEESEEGFESPEVMLFMIIELVGSTGYSAIKYNDPVSLEELKPYLHRTILDIIRQHTIQA